ncbi:MAG: universal stress protein [Flammeovirgaceae bacterium]|nr:universal stress protein [Flammeovirgaceae bacterium]
MKALVDAVRNKIMEDDVNCDSEVHFCENVARQVLAIANDKKPDLIVITATLDSSIRDFFLGPYTQDIVNHAAFPVFSIRPEQTKHTASALQGLLQGYTIKQEAYA